MPGSNKPVLAGFVTAEDVARLAGVSRSAVSRTFTPGASVSRDVRARVQTAAQSVGYRVNRLAQSLALDNSPLVGIVAANIDTPFNAALLARMGQVLSQNGMQCLLLDATHVETGIAPLIERILEFRARAVIIMSGSPSNAIVEECLRSKLRVVLVNRPIPGVQADLVLSDDVAGARLAADQLLRSGARRLAVVAGGSGTPSQRRRIDAFRRYVAGRGVETTAWAAGVTSYETGQRAARELLTGERPDGVFCVTDLLALGFMDVARYELGMNLPGELGIVGFDDVPEAGWLAYRLTTIRQSVEGLSRAALAAVMRESGQGTTNLIPIELVERESVRRT